MAMCQICIRHTGLNNVFQICSRNAFGIGSPPVSLKPTGVSPGQEKSPLGGALSNGLSARSLERSSA